MHSQQCQDELKALLKEFDEWVVADQLKRYSTSSSMLPANITPGAAIPSSSSPSSQTLGPLTPAATSPLPPSSPLPISSLPEASLSLPAIPAKADVKKMVKIYIYLEVSILVDYLLTFWQLNQENDVPIELDGWLEHGTYPLLVMILSVISQNSLMPLGTFTTLSSNPSLESQPFPSNRSMAMMNFWLFILNHSQIRIAPGFTHSSVTLWTIFGLVWKSASACSVMMVRMVTGRESEGQIDFIHSQFIIYTHFYSLFKSINEFIAKKENNATILDDLEYFLQNPSASIITFCRRFLDPTDQCKQFVSNT